MASPSIIGGSDTGTLSGGASSTSDSFTVTVASTGQNRCFLGMTGHGAGGEVSSATLGGTAMSLVTFTIGQQYVSFYYLVNPPTGSQTLTVNFPSSASGRFHRGFTLQDVDQTTVIDVSGNANGSGVTTLSKAVTTTVNNTLVWAFIHGATDNSLAQTWSATDAFTNQKATGGDNVDNSASYKEQTTAGSITASYSMSSTSPEMGVIAIRYTAPLVTSKPAFLLNFM